MKIAFRLLALLLVLLLAWYLVGDRFTPYTSNARVRSYVTPIVPQVSGIVTEVEAVNGELVEAGAVLARIDRRPFENDRAAAEADLKQALQSLGAGSARVEAAQAGVSRARSDLENVTLQTARVFELERKELIAVARADDARASLSAAQSALAAAEAELEQARASLGPEGADNPAVQRALADLARADLNLEWTELRAPSPGIVTNLNIAAGSYARAGAPLMNFIDTEQIWIEAYLTENNMGRLEVGDPAEVVLDIHPGRVFPGRLLNASAAAADGPGEAAGDLAQAPQSSGWLAAPMRFPVRILLPGYEVGDPDDDVRFQINGRADVIVYATENRLLTRLGQGFIRVMAWLSYAY